MSNLHTQTYSLTTEKIYSVGNQIDVHNSSLNMVDAGILTPVVLTNYISAHTLSDINVNDNMNLAMNIDVSGNVKTNNIIPHSGTSISTTATTINLVGTTDVTSNLKVNNIIPHSGSSVTTTAASINLVGTTDVSGNLQVNNIAPHSGAGVNLNADVLINGTLGVTGAATFGSSVILSNVTTSNEQETTKEIVFDTLTSSVRARKYNTSDVRKLHEYFEYVSCIWNAVPGVTIPIITVDLETGLLSVPGTSNTLGTVNSNYIWRFQTNNAADLYVLNRSQGLYVYHPATAIKHWVLCRPFRCYKSLSGGIYFSAKIFIAELGANRRVFCGLTESDTLFALDGENTFTASANAIGYLYAPELGNNNLYLFVRKSSVSYTLDTGLAVSDWRSLRLEMKWDNAEHPNLYFSYYNGFVSASALISDIPGASNLANDLLLDPIISCYTPASSLCKVGCSKMVVEHYINS